jgi:hypothetical protein
MTMSIGLLFWILMILAFVFGLYGNWPGQPTRSPFVPVGNTFLLFVLLFLLGWGVFGFVLQGPGAPMAR